jgi:hypothetical protein
MAYPIEYGNEGTDIRRLQLFLTNKMGADVSPDGHYGPNTRNAIFSFQRARGLPMRGVVDRATYEALESEGLILRGAPPPEAEPGEWPDKPSNLAQPTASWTEKTFGRFEYRHAPLPDNPEYIEILDGWQAENIVTIDIPELDYCLYPAANTHAVRAVGRIECHRLAAPIFKRLFERWHEAGLIDRILTYDGAFNSRLKRGSKSAKRANLSNHTWGTALDINASLNPLATIPVYLEARGCLRELVGVANAVGCYWGGHFDSRRDGMHFEIAKV